ncbi:MAG: 7-carboxy-7-deazaguanine synthase QueE [Bacteroidota bacterium]
MTETEQEKLLEQGIMLPLMEEFYSLQGEGYHTGQASYFIRIGGCDVGCHWCDVKESWDAKLHPPTMVDKIVENAAKYAKTVVITGGEPLMWNLDYISRQLHSRGIKVHIETSGAYPITGRLDWICLSPKKTSLPLEDNYKEADELKVIIQNKNDFKFAVEQALKVNDSCKLYLQPEWSQREKMLPQIVDFILEHPEWKASLQTHKYMNIP